MGMCADESLWWDSFVVFFSDLENSSLPSTSLSPSMASKLKRNRPWLLDSISMFKLPNPKSKSALDSSQVSLGPHQLTVKPHLKEAALKASSCLCLDEVQSFILVCRALEGDQIVEDDNAQGVLHLILLQYYIERQCLLKCIRQILLFALYVTDGSHEGETFKEEALHLVSSGLEGKLLSILEDLLASKHPEQMEVDLVTLWAEETLVEVNLILDILFLAYYENFSTCKVERWSRLCLLFQGILSNSLNIGKLALSIEAESSLNNSKIQLLLILIEALDLDHLLLMVHNEVPFREGHSAFSLVNIQEMDVVMSSFNVLETVEVGPLILSWAVFLCLLSSLPEKEESNPIMEIDHVAYVRQAFDASPLNYILEILGNDLLTESDGPVGGYRSVLRTFISAFVASYEITLETEDATFSLILNILCKIYYGEESLCLQFWDKDSFVDGPIRSLVCGLESEFPFRTVELIRILSALSEGTWPSECVFNFFNNMVGVTFLLENTSDCFITKTCETIVTKHQLHVPGVEGLFIPGGTRGHVLKVIDDNFSLIRWECMHLGIYVLLLRLAQGFHYDTYEEVFVTLDLLCRMVSFNTAICFALLDVDNSYAVQPFRKNGQLECNIGVDVVKVLCSLASNMSPSIDGVRVMSTCIKTLTKMLKCSPSRVAAIASMTNVFNLGINGSWSGTWLFSGDLARMLLMDCEQNDESCSLTISVLEFTVQLIEIGVEDNMLAALLVFSLQYVLVNHEHWKYKFKHARWQVTVKVLDVLRKCVKMIQGLKKLGSVILGVLLNDSSVHNTIFRLICVTNETLEGLYVSRLFQIKEIEWLQLAICTSLEYVLDILDLYKDFPVGIQTFHQALLSSSTQPIPVVTALISFLSFYRNPAMQVVAAKILSTLCRMANKAPPRSLEGVCFISDQIQVRSLRASVCNTVSKETERKDFFLSMVQILTSAATYQPSLLLSLLSKNKGQVVSNTSNIKDKFPEAPVMSLEAKGMSIVDSILQYVRRSNDLFESHPNVLLNVLDFLKALWQGAGVYIEIHDMLQGADKFWAQLTSFIPALAMKKGSSIDYLEDDEALHLAYRFECVCNIMLIMANEIFIRKRMVEHDEDKASALCGVDCGSVLYVKKTKSDSSSGVEDIVTDWCEHSVMENLIQLFAPNESDKKIILHAKLAVSLFIVHLMGKLLIGDTGSISLSLVENVIKISEKLIEQPAFTELQAHYSVCNYSKGKELNALIFSDLYYHVQGELEGREITPGPFRELSQFLLQLEYFQIREPKHDMAFRSTEKLVYLFDPELIQKDLGLAFWDHSNWKASKSIAERMLSHMHDANLVAYLADSKHSALKALTYFICIYEANLAERKPTLFRGVNEKTTKSCIESLCKCLQLSFELLVPPFDASKVISSFLETQAELLLNLVVVLFKLPSLQCNGQNLSQVCALLIKTSGTGIKILNDMRPSTFQIKKMMKLYLTLLLTSLEFSCPKIHSQRQFETIVSEAVSEISLVCLGLLPVLCRCVETAEICDLALAAMDALLKGILTTNTWLPVLQKHLQLSLLLQKLQQKDSHVSVSTTLKFLLTLAHFRGGAQMLQINNFFPSLKMLLNASLEDKPFQCEIGILFKLKREEKPHHIWGLTMAIVASVISYLGDAHLLENTISYFFTEKSYLISNFLSSPEFPSDNHYKKRARSQKSQTSLTALRETEYTLMLICALAKHQYSWSVAMKEIETGLREMSIHLLAFISRGAQRLSESPSGIAPLVCPPVLKDEMDFIEKPAFVPCTHGWFTLSALGCMPKASVSALSSKALSLISKNQANGSKDLGSRTYFSDVVAIQLYKIAFLILKFLCIQAKLSAWRAEGVGFIDLAHFPELPMPEILHGLQDQAIAIATELCDAKLKSSDPEVQDLCVLLLQILEKSMYLELCVSQTCGIRPVLGRVEDFSKEIKSLIRVAEGHSFLKGTLKSLRQITTLLYPGLMHVDGIM